MSELMFNKLYDVAPADIQAQFRGGNIEQFIKGVSEIKKKYLQNAFNSLKNDNMNITTAKQDALDLWGNLLGFYRYIPRDDNPADAVRYFNFNDKVFKRLQFLNPNKPNYGTLPDDLYRRFLSLIYQGMFVVNTVPNINQFINSFFSEYDKIVVRDSLDMSYVVYVFVENSPMPEWLKWILSNYDILPRPAGVGSSFESYAKLRRFGFAPKTDISPFFYENIGAFNGTNFKGEL